MWDPGLASVRDLNVVKVRFAAGGLNNSIHLLDLGLLPQTPLYGTRLCRTLSEHALQRIRFLWYLLLGSGFYLKFLVFLVSFSLLFKVVERGEWCFLGKFCRLLLLNSCLRALIEHLLKQKHLLCKFYFSFLRLNLLYKLDLLSCKTFLEYHSHSLLSKRLVLP